MDDQTLSNLPVLLAAQRASFELDKQPSCATRLDRLDRLFAMGEQGADDIVAAISADFGHRAQQETLLAELSMIQAAIVQTKRHLASWMKPKRVKTPLSYLPASNQLIPQPLGVVGVISPWNYPYQLAIGPVICAIAAGNRVMIKPSELTPKFSELLQVLVKKYFAVDEITVVTGGVEVAQAFSSLAFDHLVFTGSTAVGRQVAIAAAKNLTPVTLELGGKSPAIFDHSANLDLVIPRLAFAKFLNAGQTCIAPDYLMVPKGQAQSVADQLKEAVHGFYPDAHNNPDYTSIINERHLARLEGLLSEAVSQGAKQVDLAGPRQPNNLSVKLLPSAVLGVTQDMQIMQEEIFGPILPIMEYDSLDDALAYVNSKERPLALYWFGQDSERKAQVLNGTISGGVTINDCVWHFAQEAQPFGGVGASGQGAYHGKWGFDAFSKLKPVFTQSRFSAIRLLYPPYGATFTRMLKVLKLIA